MPVLYWHGFFQFCRYFHASRSLCRDFHPYGSTNYMSSILHKPCAFQRTRKCLHDTKIAVSETKWAEALIWTPISMEAITEIVATVPLWDTYKKEISY